MRISSARKFTPLAVGVAALALILAACSGGGAVGAGGDSDAEVGVTEDTIYLAASQTLSGPGAASCAPSTDAAKLYFDKVNAEGGIDGRKIDFEVIDDAYDPQRALANVRGFIDSKFAMVGACGSATAAAVYKTLSSAGMPFLFPTNGVAEVVKPAAPGVFQILPLYEDQTAALVQYGFEEFGAGSIFVVVNPLGEYESAIERAREAAEQGGGEFAGSAVAQLGTTDYTPIALQIKEAEPDFVVISTGGSDSAKFVNALVDQNALPAKGVLGTSAAVAGSFLNSYNVAAAEHLYLGSATQLPAAADNECIELLAGGDFANDPIAHIGCASAMGIVQAIRQTSPLTREGLMKTIESWSEEDVSPGVFAPVSFSAEDHIGLATLYIVQPKGSEFNVIAQCPYSEDDSAVGGCTAAG
ncbi:ABC transporter substrate-binding protein [Microbacterium sp.]|uniref:ABC transporter substrate-binding protein n=1 Tax=Microbacterium sp. TaxID=51671 RepID=UPI002D7A3B45|nr:ABC transporter substrate-binding protein [Microbacterium sp.]HET6299977.1 ABC transporter substrate-binding protein [Microbacterium sp.]